MRRTALCLVAIWLVFAAVGATVGYAQAATKKQPTETEPVLAEASEADARLAELRGEMGKIVSSTDAEIKTRVEAAIKDLEKLRDAALQKNDTAAVVAIESQILALRKATIATAPISRFKEFSDVKLTAPAAQGTSAGTTPRPVERKPAAESPPELVKPVPLPIIAVMPKSEPGKSEITSQNSTHEGIKLVRFNFYNWSRAGDAIWSEKGDAFFVLSGSGLLQRIGMKEGGFVEERRIDLGQNASSLALSGVGLLVALQELQEVWIVDPVTLDVQKRIYAPSAAKVLSGPTLHFAVAVHDIENRTENRKDSVAVYLDLDKGNPVVRQTVPVINAALSPDGKRYFGQNEALELQSYRWENFRLVKDQSSQHAAPEAKRTLGAREPVYRTRSIFVSPDSKRVCITPLMQSSDIRAETDLLSFVYATDDLKKPEFMLQTGVEIRCVGFDLPGSRIYAQGSSSFMVFDDKGAKLKEYKSASIFGSRGSTPSGNSFVVHPEGKQLLLKSDASLSYAELPE